VKHKAIAPDDNASTPEAKPIKTTPRQWGYDIAEREDSSKLTAFDSETCREECRRWRKDQHHI